MSFQFTIIFFKSMINNTSDPRIDYFFDSAYKSESLANKYHFICQISNSMRHMLKANENHN